MTDRTNITVDFTQVNGVEDFFPTVLKYLSDADVTNLAQTDRWLREFTRKERLRRKVTTFGAAALTQSHEDFIDNVLGDTGKWKVSEDAMTVVARTFSGTRQDRIFTCEKLYPENLDSHLAFQKVREWWEWMCDNNRDIALRTDMLAFFLCAGEAYKPQRESRQYLDVFYKFNAEGIRDNKTRIVTYTQDQTTFYGSVTKAVSLWSDDYKIQLYGLEDRYDGLKLTVSLVDAQGNQKTEFVLQRRASELGPVDNPGEVPDLKLGSVDTSLWAHACVNKIASATQIASLYHAEILNPSILKTLHVVNTKDFFRVRLYEQRFEAENSLVMF